MKLSLTRYFYYTKVHLKLGYALVLVLIDTAIILLVAWDLWRFKAFGISTQEWIRQLRSLSTSVVLQSGFIAVTFFIVLPTALAAIRIRTGGGVRLRTVLGINNRVVVALHCILGLALTMALPCLRMMELASGYSLEGGLLCWDYSSLYSKAVATTFLGGWALGIFVLIYMVVPLARAWTLEGKEHPPWVREYLVRCRLADNNGWYCPVKRADASNFNGPALAAELRYVRWHSASIIDKYQANIPGSEAARDYLMGKLRDCKELINQFCLPNTPKDSWKFELYACTGRALEIAIRRCNCPNIVLSPFEHPTVEAVCRVVGQTTGAQVLYQPFGLVHLMKPWNDQLEIAKKKLKKVLRGSRGDLVIIVSDVCYINGVQLPIRALIGVLRELVGEERKVRVIVDGAHAIGVANCEDGLECCDYYVASAHKWLFAGEPSGLLFWKNHQHPNDIAVYDAWGEEAPSSTMSAMSIAHLHAALELMGEMDVKSRSERAQELKRRLEDALKERFCSLGASSDLEQIPISALVPATGWRWKLNGSVPLKTELARLGVNAAVLALNGDLAVRLIFAHYLDVPQVDRAITALDSLVERIPGVF